MLWDIRDNLEASYKNKAGDFDYIYYNSLSKVFETYSRYIGWHLPNFHQHYKLLSDDQYRDKYLINEFPDLKFQDEFLDCFSINKKEEKLNKFNKLVDYLLEEMGGFQVDGWKIRTDVDINI